MANLMITTACNFRCKYCFGLDMIGPNHPTRHMSFDLFLSILDWIDKGSPPDLGIHLMGGEPTLSPLFIDMVREIVRRGRQVVVFSNAATGIADEAVAETVELGAGWIVNCNAPDTYRDGQLERLHRHLAILGKAAVVTLNITSQDTPYDYVFDYIDQFGLSPAIKLGVALPTYEQSNQHATFEDLPGIADQIMAMYRKARSLGIGLGFECGVAYCLFNKDQHKELENIHVSHCGSRLDITPDGEVINCLPLCKVASVPYTRFADYNGARSWFADMLTPYRQIGGMADCLGCADRLAGKCSCCVAYGLAEYNRIVLPPLPSTVGDCLADEKLS